MFPVPSHLSLLTRVERNISAGSSCKDLGDFHLASSASSMTICTGIHSMALQYKVGAGLPGRAFAEIALIGQDPFSRPSLP